MNSDSLLTPNSLVSIISLIYAVSICIAVVNLLGYYQYFDAIWILKEFSLSYILIYSTSFFFAILGSAFSAYQFYKIRTINHPKVSIKDILIKSSSCILFFLILIITLFYFSKINADSIIFFILYGIGFILTYIYLFICDQSHIEIHINAQIKISMAFLMFSIILTSGYCSAALKFHLGEFYTVDIVSNSEKFYLLEATGDKAIIFTLDSSPPKKMKYKIINTSDIKLIYKD
jgi:hypothetical protein